MLKKIPGCISPELMKVMMQMGHGDELVLADADFPADTYGKRVIRADGLRSIGLLKAIMEFFPLDPFAERPVAVMGPADNPNLLAFLNEVKRASAEQGAREVEIVERFAFYGRAEKAFAVVITGEPDGNIILKKGVVNL